MDRSSEIYKKNLMLRGGGYQPTPYMENIGGTKVTPGHQMNASDSRKQVFKSSKGFRVILNSVDERKISNYKKISNSSNLMAKANGTQSLRREDDSHQSGRLSTDKHIRNISM